MHWSDYWEAFLKGDPRATGKLINILENEQDLEIRKEIMQACARQGKRSYLIGITGPPGAGKSTTVDRLGSWILDQGLTLGVVAIDPSSPFLGGALLGDRIRMENLSKRKGCFIRSMATRGTLGGLSVTAQDVVHLLQAGGYDVILVETVGTGQTEHDIISVADTIILLTVPGLGDRIQMAKAGIMEIGDVFVVNQSDRPGAEEAYKSLKIEVEANYKGEAWKPSVVSTVATDGKGIEELGREVFRHRDYLKESGKLDQLYRDRNRQTWLRLVKHSFVAKLERYLQENNQARELAAAVEGGALNIYEATDRMLEMVQLAK